MYVFGKLLYNVRSLSELLRAIWRNEWKETAEINRTVYAINEFRSKFRGNFSKTVLAEKKLFVIGDEYDLRKLGQQSMA